MRQRVSRSDAGSQDSFLDIVTNIVGILIILVMVIGARVQSISIKPQEITSPNLEKLMMEVVRLEDAIVASESELVDLDEQSGQLAGTVADAGNARIHLATAVSAARWEVEDQKQKVDKDKTERVERANQQQRIKDEIAQCNLEADGIAHAPQSTKELLAYPTPVGRTVTGDELHFRLAAGRISYIPLTERLIKRKHEHKEKGVLASMESRIETAGPVSTMHLIMSSRAD